MTVELTLHRLFTDDTVSAVCYRSRYVVKCVCNNVTASSENMAASDVISRCDDEVGGRCMSSPRS